MLVHMHCGPLSSGASRAGASQQTSVANKGQANKWGKKVANKWPTTVRSQRFSYLSHIVTGFFQGLASGKQKYRSSNQSEGRGGGSV